MAGFTSYDDLIAKLTTAGKRLEWRFIRVAPAAVQGVGSWQTLWKATGSPGAGGDPAGTPGISYNSDANRIGGMSWADVNPELKFALTFGGISTIAGNLMIYDRLVGVGGVSIATTGAKTVNSVALPRYASGIDVQPFLEVTTATTTTAPVVNLNQYTNELGGTGRAGPNLTFPAAATVLHCLLMPPIQAGDKGVRSIEAGLNVTTAGATGIVTVGLMKELATIPLPANVWNEVDLVLQLAAIPPVMDGACLCLAFQAAATGTPTVVGRIRIGYG